MQEKRSENVMTRLSRFIVDKRKAFFMVFLVASVFCVGSIDKVEVNDDITSYLPAETETRRGLDLMEQEFITLASADVMVDNITYQRAEASPSPSTGRPTIRRRRRPSKRSGRYWRTMTPTSPPRWDGTPPPISSGRWASSS